MQTERFTQKMSDGAEIAVNRWIPDEEESIKALVVLSHGMLEHSLRYDRVGSIFAEKGFLLSGHDHRGHGKTAQLAESNGTGCFGKLADKDGFNRVTDDLLEIVDELKKDYPGKKVILLSHSFGSFVAQNYIEKYGDTVDGAVLIGSSGPMRIAGVGHAFASLVCAFFGTSYRSRFIQHTAFANYNAHIKNPESAFDWLCTNRENLMMYANDSWCGGTSCASFFRDMTGGLCQIHRKRSIREIPKDLPLLFLYGAEDPVGAYGKSLEKLMALYASCGVNNAELRRYEGDRHELLNEKNSDKIISDIFDWIEKNVSL